MAAFTLPSAALADKSSLRGTSSVWGSEVYPYKSLIISAIHSVCMSLQSLVPALGEARDK